jgi:hypothetical protein
MNPEEAFAQWRVDLGTRTSPECHWSRLAEALGRLVLHNSHGVHGRVVLARLNDVDGIVSDLRVALAGYDEESGPRPRDERQIERRAAANLLWAHLKPEIAFLQGSDSDHYRAVDRHLLEQVIERYLRSQWLTNDVLEWMMADASVYHDVVSFGEAIKRNFEGLNEALHAPETGRSARRLAFRLAGVFGELSAFVAGPIVLAALAPHFVSGRHLLWILPAALACVATYAIVAVARALRRKRRKVLAGKSLAQWSAMAAAYRSLEGPLVSIGQVKHELKKAAARGANWTAQAFALLEYAEARGARTWKL